MSVEGKSKNNRTEILVVEDSLTQAEQLKYILEKTGYHVTVAYNGKEALSSISKHKPGVVISDIVMPEMDGYELCQQIKTDENLKDIPIILLTALSDPSDVIKGLGCGADHFVTKPYDENYLLARIQYILANWELHKGREIEMGVEILIGGRKHFINADRLQILHLLISTYEAAVQQNHELVMARNELKRLNEQLEEKVEERTAALKEEIAQHWLTEESLRKSEGKLSAMLRSIGDHISMMDKDLNIIWANDIAKKIFGNDIVGKKCYEAYHKRKEPCEPYPCFTFKAFQDEKVHKQDIQVTDKDGNIMHFHCTANVALKDNEGKPTAVIEISRDITEQKRIAESLKKSEEELKKRVKELERFYDMAVGRELRMTELKEEIAELREKLRKYETP